jgi:hypothetical protein
LSDYGISAGNATPDESDRTRLYHVAGRRCEDGFRRQDRAG